ncbi:MAG: hypothetical protein D6681_04010 [Calditrichaeota bacterium]|nr:MAG: hypothetical protein D6681_04010 [Calditrichota bacterium]
MSDLSGQRIAHYHILERIGHGGMGVVYKARDLKLNRLVALKFLPPYLSTDEEAKKRFLKEARAASSLDHPNICNIHDIGETDDGQMYICMTFYEGQTLKAYIQEHQGLLSVGEAVDIAIHIAEGLAKAHRNDLIHRDIKPANIMITPEKQVKILDFGLVKVRGQTQITEKGVTLGTIAYMAPEQLVGEKVDHRADIWALGVVLYEMLVGKPPFMGDNDQATHYLILNTDPPQLSGQRSGLPLELEHIIGKALQKDPRDRYQQVEEMLIDLRNLKKKLDATSPFPRFVPEAAPPRRRLPKPSRSITGLALFLLAGVLGLYIWFRSASPASPAPDRQRIAVLPFTNLSPEEEGKYFADGITEELISTLSQIRALKVIARTSVMAYKNSGKPLTEIARELRVGTAVEGSVQKNGERLRINVRLVDMSRGDMIWSNRYNVRIRDVFTVQEEIARSIAQELQIKLLARETRQIRKQRPIDEIAGAFYFKGRYYWNQRTREGAEQGIAYFYKAIERDPLFVKAYTGLADAFGVLGYYNYIPPREAFPRAIAAARKALEIDSTLGEAHASLAPLLLFYQYDLVNAGRHFRKALELNPGYASAHQWYAVYLAVIGQFEESLREIHYAEELDPLSPIIATDVVEKLYYARRFREAIDYSHRALAFHGQFFPLHYFMGLSYLQAGEVGEAVHCFRNALKYSGGHPGMLSALAYAYGVQGQVDSTRYLLARLQALSRQQYISPYYLGMIHSALGEMDRAFAYLEKAYQERTNWLVFIRVDPLFDPLRDDPRYRRLLEKIGFVDEHVFSLRASPEHPPSGDYSPN